MQQPFPHLFQPLSLRHPTLRNHIVFGAHTANMSVDGLPGERHLAYYRERARGGAAMIVVEPVPVHATAVLTRGNFRHSDDAIIPHFRPITEAVHAEGAAALPRRRPCRLGQQLRGELVALGPALDARPGRQPRDERG